VPRRYKKRKKNEQRWLVLRLIRFNACAEEKRPKEKMFPGEPRKNNQTLQKKKKQNILLAGKKSCTPGKKKKISKGGPSNKKKNQGTVLSLIVWCKSKKKEKNRAWRTHIF